MWDAMGLSSRSYSVAVLKRLGWAGRVATSTGAGTWTLRDAEHSGTGLQALRVKAGKNSYWLEYRTNPVALDDSPGTFGGISGVPGLADPARHRRQVVADPRCRPRQPRSEPVLPRPGLRQRGAPCRQQLHHAATRADHPAGSDGDHGHGAGHPERFGEHARSTGPDVGHRRNRARATCTWPSSPTPTTAR